MGDIWPVYGIQVYFSTSFGGWMSMMTDVHPGGLLLGYRHPLQAWFGVLTILAVIWIYLLPSSKQNAFQLALMSLKKYPQDI
jgi:hypothetical protein